MRMWTWKSLLLVPALVVLATSEPAGAAGGGAILHEQIPPDPHEDLALSVSLEGDLPAALDTRSGVVAAPDPRRPVSPDDQPYNSGADDRANATFTPDRNTKRPDVQGYDEPFTPSTAPFKRLEAFDSVSATYELYVRDKRLQTVPTSSTPSADGSEEQFYADLVVDVGPGKKVRIPSVGPGARIVRANLRLGDQDVGIHVWRDGAENWFVEGFGSAARARLVMVLTIPRGVFGGEFHDASWGDLPKVAPLPENVQKAAREVSAAIGVSTALRPRDNVDKLVQYFRSFVDSEEPPSGRRDIYLDLALSKKGVCRHRAFAFMITAQSLGLPTRMAINEAHAWVEVHDGTMWRRIDLGGAGRMTNPASNTMPERPVHQPPPDNFSWPQGAEPGQDMVDQARQRGKDSQTGPNGKEGDSNNPNGTQKPAPSPSGSGSGQTRVDTPGHDGPGKDERPGSTVTIQLGGTDAHRGMPLHVKGDVKAEGDVCSNVMVEVLLHDPKDSTKEILVGSIATNEKGEYTGSIVVPTSVPLGDYDLIARTAGDTRCGRGSSQ